MPGNISKQEYNSVLESVSGFLSSLREAASLKEEYRKEIIEKSDLLIRRKVMELLKDVPVDELNRDKRGFRVKTLKENGFETMADIAPAGSAEIASVDGISLDKACEIRVAADSIIEETRRSVKFRLSSDDKTEESGALLLAVLKYRESDAFSSRAAVLLKDHESEIARLSEECRYLKNGFRWLFTASENKKKALKAFDALQNLLTGAFAKASSEIIKNAGEVRRLTEHTAWDGFEKNPVIYSNTLEEVNPGVLGNDDSVYGLPQELAAALRDECVFPEGLKCELRNYQVWGVKFILHQGRVLLGDEMGLGKTVQAIACMVSLKNTGATHFVVVCPAGVLTNWCREIRKMSMLSVIKVHGEHKNEAFKEWLSVGGVAVTTFETAWLFNSEEYTFSMLTVDEAHYIKNPEAQRTVFVKKLCEKALRVLFMTGTALENNVHEMVSLIEILDPATASKLRRMEYLSSAERFRDIAAKVYYRRRREDVLTELPELIENYEWCTLNDAEKKKYNESVLARNYADIRRVSWNVADVKDSSKAARLKEIADEAAEDGRKLIVFSFFLDTLKKAEAVLEGRCLTEINGSVPPAKRQQIIDEFDKAPAGTALSCQIQSGGTGLNIQAASVIVLCEPQLKPSIENQAVSRAYRMGQTRNVLVYRLLSDDTVDEDIISLLEEKQAVFDAFADRSAAAEKSPELDGISFTKIIEDEIERIKTGNTKR